MRLPWQPKPEARDLTEVQWFRMFENRTTKAGESVTADTAVYSLVTAACILVRSKAVGTLPLHLYRVTESGRQKDADRPEYGVFKTAWNPSTPAPFGWRWVQQQVDMDGNAYVRIERKGGRVVGLHQMTGETQTVVSTEGGIPRVVGYKNRASDSSEWTPVLFDDVLHFRSDYISTDGITGRSLVDVAREAIGLDLAADEFLGSFFQNGTHFGNVLSTDQALTPEDMEAIRDMLKDHKGVAPAHKARLFTKGIKPVDVPSNMKDNDLVQLRRYNLERICGVFTVPLVKVQAMWFGTYSNTEQSSLDWAKDGVTPMAVAIEQTINAKLYPDAKNYVKFELNALMRGDFATRMQGLASAVNGGIFTPNEARAWEELDPLPGGDELRFPLNSVPASQMEAVEDEPDETVEEEPDDNVVALPQAASRRAAGKNRLALQRSMRGMFEDAARRIVRREVNDIRREANRSLGARSVQDFQTWLDGFYRDFPDFYAKQLEPVVRSYGEAIADLAAAEANGAYDPAALDAFIKGYVGTSSKRYMSSHLGQLKALLDSETDKLAAIEERLTGWEDTSPTRMSGRESVEAAGAFAKWAFAAAGVTRLMWTNTSERSCPYCESLDGQVVGIDSAFVNGGGSVDTEAGSLPVTHDSFHPPIHEGCECIIVPA